MLPIAYHRLALREYRKQVRYYDSIARTYMVRFAAAVDDAEDAIRTHPHIGSPHRLGTRVWVVKGFPFHLVYNSSSNSIYVIALAYHHRRPGYWRRRVP